MADSILEILEELSNKEFKTFKFCLNYQVLKECRPIPRSQLEDKDRTDVVMLMEKFYDHKMVEVTLEILKKIPRKDLIGRLMSNPGKGAEVREQTVRKRPSDAILNSPEVKRKRSLNMEPVFEAQQAGTQSMTEDGSLLNSSHQDLETKKKMCAERVREKLKSRLKNRFECIYEGLAKPGKHTLLNSIYTELYITEGDCEGVNEEHEVWQIETASRTHAIQDTAIKCNDIFKPLYGQEIPIRTVLTKGIAGIGKTVSVQKFTLDWAEGKANQDVDFIFFLPFRELNLINEEYSLLELLKVFHPEMKGFENIEFDNYKVLFIFDGLDEWMNFSARNRKILSDVRKKSPADVLVTNLLKKNLFPSALLWITSRPAAANWILPELIHRVTEVRGFNDAQKEEYFRKRFRDQNLVERSISHIKTSRSLYIMCHIPLFCWMSATVLERLLSGPDSGELPKSLTEMYSYFLYTQAEFMQKKYQENHKTDAQKILEPVKEIFLKLGQLAFQHLERGNSIFYEEDLRKCDIDVTEASVYSGVCTEILKEESVLHQKKVYCFVHLSLQEYLAALYVIHSFIGKNFKALKPFFGKKTLPNGLSLSDFHKKAIKKALESKNGHLDLFLRFLLGLSLDSNQRLVQGLLTQTGSNPKCIQKTVQHIKVFKEKDPSPERCINLFHCLSELNDDSLVKDVQKYLSSGSPSGEKISPAHCSVLAYVLLVSEEELEFDLRKYNTSEEGRRRLVPAVKCCRKAVLSGCNLTMKSLQSVDCALQSVSSPLRELDLSNNNLGDSGVELLCSALKSPNCKLQTLRLRECNLTDGCCDSLASVLRSSHSELRDLELRDNELQDSGVRALSAGLEDPHCKLQRLGLSGCQVTESGCASLASALRSNPSHLRELDLSYNNPGESGVTALSAGLEDPSCRLEILLVDHGGETRLKPGLRKYAVQLTLDPNTAHRKLSLSEENRRVIWGNEQPYPDHPERFNTYHQLLCREGLSERCYWEAEWSVEKGGKLPCVAMAFKTIGRKGWGDASLFGYNDKSWSLYCSKQKCSAIHRKTTTDIPAPPSPFCRVGVYLDWPAGTLSFYSVSSDTRTLLHTFHTTFTEPLYPGFKVNKGNSVTLCMLG
ncbi:NACHT, LRR and PYD domains-containing protein 3-like isoform X1 [Anguilla anguilla]|uniref:NACHT, LRR and PYD domains-containing protein 3-like isoform X1 n=2 Tax=Anguilla anguilla TaxID=7936 RepID=UPI0015B34FBE|nr:NACHT, LRR and PYD domains-containing protein 3-like isoform X1 [Anguilla anguilla]XP_035262476.1 NACHT, LRR and PYD domains-containing protein 3-like isoform X1 [Anguilla anguilla]XP_035262477.1 NACHT, LRR and PYD domains-containing protein 3-like isoform X1 [Anguilla anguilla]